MRYREVSNIDRRGGRRCVHDPRSTLGLRLPRTWGSKRVVDCGATASMPPCSPPVRQSEAGGFPGRVNGPSAQWASTPVAHFPSTPTSTRATCSCHSTTQEALLDRPMQVSRFEIKGLAWMDRKNELAGSAMSVLQEALAKKRTWCAPAPKRANTSSSPKPTVPKSGRRSPS